MNYFQPRVHKLPPTVNKWDMHFRRVSRHAKTPASFGASLSLPQALVSLDPSKTIPDLKNLIVAKDNEILQIMKHMNEVLKSKGTIDPVWLKDWASLNKRYFVAKQNARKFIDDPKGFNVPKPFYDGVLKSLSQAYPDLRVVPGDLQDMYNRMPFEMKPLPQPGVTTADATHQILDTAASHMPTPVKAFVATVQPDLVPQTKDAGSYETAKKQMEAVGDWIGHNLTMVAVIAGGVAVVAVASKMPAMGGGGGSMFGSIRRTRRR